MKRIILTLIIGIFLVSFTKVKAQPFIYFNTQIADTIYGPLKKVVRYDIFTNSVEDFLPQQTLSKNVTSISDPSQSYLIIYHHRQGFKLYDCANISTNYDLGIWGSQIHEDLFSAQTNTLYIFSNEYRKLSAFSFSSGTVSSEINLGKAGYNNDLMDPTRTSFFSSDSGKIYFYNLNTNDIDQVWTYSLDNNQIIQKINLAELGNPGSDGYDLNFGRNGKGIISSDPDYNNPVRDFYYRIYDFDNNIGSDFIYHNGLSEAYFANDGDLLLIMNTFKDDSTWEYYHTGEGYIYKTSNGQLLKTLNLPSHGKIYTFDNYPNNIYYVKDIELPTRQIYTLKMDSIFNVLDLTSLSPTWKIVNSPPFTLTVNGHGFDTLSTVYFNDSAKTTTFVNDSVLTASISTSDISIIGNYPVWVTDEWGISDTLIFAVTPVPPVLVSISPSLSLRSNALDQPGIILGTVKGSNYTKSSVVYFNGLPKTTTYISDSTLNFAINVLLDIPNTAGDLPVWVNNLSTNSDTLIFSVVNLLPQPVTPLLSCVRDNGNRTFTAFFEYNNLNSSSVLLPLGGKNNFHILAPDRGQPKIFMPGLQTNVFSVTFDGNPITWTLNGISVTATKKSPACP